MYGGNGRNGFGLGLALGICLTLTFCVASWWSLQDLIGNKQDTLAQWIMAIFGIVATALSAWAVVLLHATLEQTRAANLAAQEAVEVTRTFGKLQTQAYVSFHNTILHLVFDQGKPKYLQVKAVFKNTGNSPARLVAGFCELQLLPSPSLQASAVAQKSGRYRLNMAVGAGEDRWIMTDPMDVGKISTAIRSGFALVAIGAVEYSDVFEDGTRLVDFAVAIAFGADPANATMGTDLPHDWHALQNYSVDFR
jgi:hypothetical protein